MMPGGMTPRGTMPGGMMPGGLSPGGGMPGLRGPGGMLPGGGQTPGGGTSPSPSGYGGSPGGSGGYGDTSGGYGGGQSGGQRGFEVILTASGVPNDGGQVRWPLGIRFLDSAEDQALRQQTEALFQVAAIHTQLGQLNPRLTWELKRAVNDLRSRLQERNDRRPLPWADYQEAQRFLNRLAKAPELLAQVLPTPSGS